MPGLPPALQQKMEDRIASKALRKLSSFKHGVDFYSNDYLGFAQNQAIADETKAILGKTYKNGSTGSRLIAGNYMLLEQVENELAKILGYSSTLSFGSGYAANVGFFSCVPQKGDVVLYDKLIHASVHDGLGLSKASKFSFQHNDLTDLETKLSAHANETVYVVTEGVFSMDGDEVPLLEMAALCAQYGAHLIVDEAHSYGVIGQQGEGLVASLGLQHKVFATLYTFGKAMGTHGAAWAVSDELREYLINFSRAFIFSTGIAPHQIAAMQAAAEHNTMAQKERQQLSENVAFFRSLIDQYKLPFVISNSPIQIIKTEGNEATDVLVDRLTARNFLVKGIKYPTVPPKSTRIRLCLHSFNTKQEISQLFEGLVQSAV